VSTTAPKFDFKSMNQAFLEMHVGKYPAADELNA
jgi:hypothetical protein